MTDINSRAHRYCRATHLTNRIEWGSDRWLDPFLEPYSMKEKNNV
jgi:hypothetical protein